MVRVAPYDPNWKHEFQLEAERITHALSGQVITLHHIGSTAIPGIWAKPIIDILIEATDIVQLTSRTFAMEELGYEAMGEFGIPGRRYFRKRNASDIRTHHVHAYEAGNWEIQRHLAFRDYMIAHPETAAAYSELKRRLAQEHPYDSDAYLDGKDAFIKEHETKAVAWLLTRKG